MLAASALYVLCGLGKAAHQDQEVFPPHILLLGQVLLFIPGLWIEGWG